MTPVDIKSAKIELSKTSFTFNNKEQKPTIKKVVVGKKTLKAGTDYTVTWPRSPKNAGTYTVTVTGKGSYTGKASATYKINKAANTLKVKTQKDTYNVTYSNLKKKDQTIKGSKIYEFTDKKTKGDITYSLSSVKQGKKAVKKGFAVEKKDGKLKIKKSVAKGKYTVNVKITAAGNKNYNKATKTVTFTVNIK